GPCVDGGFYLLGLRRCPVGLLDDLPWSARTTFAAVLKRLEQHHMGVAVLDRWFDVDTPEDLDRLAAMIERGEIHAEETAGVLGIDSPGRVSCA
ncbi:MAG TPA: glycosyltransferase, partial [Candidatus Krumholzibacteria bacterium]